MAMITRVDADLGVDVLALDAHGVVVSEDSFAFEFVDGVLAHEESQPVHPFYCDSREHSNAAS
ncbi:hypothetical protein [Mycobacterium sp. URHB0021]